MHHFYSFKICLIVVTQNFHAEVMDFNILFSTPSNWTIFRRIIIWEVNQTTRMEMMAGKNYEELPFEIQEKVPITQLKQLLSQCPLYSRLYGQKPAPCYFCAYMALTEIT